MDSSCDWPVKAWKLVIAALSRNALLQRVDESNGHPVFLVRSEETCLGSENIGEDDAALMRSLIDTFCVSHGGVVDAGDVAKVLSQSVTPSEARLLKLASKFKRKLEAVEQELAAARELIATVSSLTSVYSSAVSSTESTLSTSNAVQPKVTSSPALVTATKAPAQRVMIDDEEVEQHQQQCIAPSQRQQQQPLAANEACLLGTGVIQAVNDEALFCSKPCDICFDASGDLCRCGNCGSWLHEMCGGPHPDDPLVVCRACRRQLGFGSESSVLSSNTSSDEHVSEDSDDDSSLSGFLVRTEDMSDEGSVDDGKSMSSSSSSSYSSSSLAPRRKQAKDKSKSHRRDASRRKVKSAPAKEQRKLKTDSAAPSRKRGRNKGTDDAQQKSGRRKVAVVSPKSLSSTKKVSNQRRKATQQ